MKPGTALSRKTIRELQARGWFATQISAAMNTGIPDILATRPGGSIHIEVKALGDTIRDSQLNWAQLYAESVDGLTWLLIEKPGCFEVVCMGIFKGVFNPRAFSSEHDTIAEAVECILTYQV